MAEIKTSNLSFKQINAIKILDGELKRDPFLLINFNELVNDLISERDSFHKQRDELINDIADIKRKAEAFDEIKVNLYHVKDLKSWETLDAKDHEFLRDIFNEIPSDWERGSDE
ncbi:hypothetical protein ACXYTD_01785 [Staphylococcus hominis]